MGLDDELHARGLKPGCQIRPSIRGQNDAEMRHGDEVPVDEIGEGGAGGVGRPVSHDLVTIKVEIDPLRAASAFRAAQEFAVEFASGVQVVNRKRKMERR